MAQKNPKGGGGTTTAGHIDNNDMFLKRALEKLLSEKDIKKSQYQQLKRACEAALGLFKLITYIKKSIFFFFTASVTKDAHATK